MSDLTINTTQNVTINFTAASIGERMLASLLDLLIKIAYGIAVSYVVFDVFNFNNWMQTWDNWSKFAIYIVIFFPILIYSLVLESIFEGQTIGKKIVKIKVVKMEGYQAHIGDFFIRWLFRIVENNLMGGLIGLIAMIISKKVQRFGDMAAGTAVITLKNNITINSTILENIDNQYVPIYPQVIKLSDNDMRIIKETFENARVKGDYETLKKLVSKIESVSGIKNQSGNVTDFIRTVLKDYNFYTQNM